MGIDYKKCWQKLRKTIKTDINRANDMYDKLNKEFTWQTHNWDDIQQLIDWEHEQTSLKVLDEMLDEIQGKKCQMCIMNNKEFVKWKKIIQK